MCKIYIGEAVIFKVNMWLGITQSYFGLTGLSLQLKFMMIKKLYTLSEPASSSERTIE